MKQFGGQDPLPLPLDNTYNSGRGRRFSPAYNLPQIKGRVWLLTMHIRARNEENTLQHLLKKEAGSGNRTSSSVAPAMNLAPSNKLQWSVGRERKELEE